MEGEVIQPDTLPVVAGTEVFLRSPDKAEVGLAREVARAVRPTLRLLVTQALQERQPERERALQIGDAELYVMKHVWRE